MSNKSSSVESESRLKALKDSGLLENEFEPMLDRLTKLASAALRVPVVLISLVDKDRQFFKSQCGLPEPWAAARETPLSHSFCRHVVESGEPLLIEDARTHDLVRENLAVRDIGVVAYAGVPVIDSNGEVLGSFCAIDVKPRTWLPEDVDLLFSLSAQVSSYLHLGSQSKSIANFLDSQKAAEADRRQMLRLNVHDLRTPLSAMMLSMDVIKLLGPMNPEQEEYLALCKRNGQTLLNLVNNMLDIGNVDEHGRAALNCSPTRPLDLALGAMEQTASLSEEKQLQIINKIDNRLPDVSVDADKMTRVIVNLLANAIKFSKDSGKIELHAEPLSEMLKFSVKDSGIGINVEQDIFAEGVRVNKNVSSQFSTGIGLTFCKKIVEVHGGKIWFDSQVNVGSTFSFTIPIAAC